jgi:serine/threonine protein phosphatase PrpC
MRGGVAPAVVARAYLGRLHPLLADEAIEEGRLAHPRGAQEGDGRAGREVWREGLEAFVAMGADHVDGRRTGEGGDDGSALLGFGAEVGFVQDHHRLRAALVGEGEVAFDPPRIEVAVESHHDERHVDVGCDHLLAILPARRSPAEACLAGKHGCDHGVPPPTLERHEVAHDRHLALAVQPPGHPRDDFPFVAPGPAPTTACSHHARRDQIAPACRQAGGEGRIVPELCERWRLGPFRIVDALSYTTRAFRRQPRANPASPSEVSDYNARAVGAAAAHPPLRPRVGGRTDRGKRRENNEDFLLLRPDLGLFVVADGVGGRSSGDVASKLAALSIGNFFEASRDGAWPESFRSLIDLTLTPPAQRLSAAVRKANRDVWDIASSRPEHDRMNTTVVAAHHEPGSDVLHVVHVGDSRCYGLRNGKLVQLTQDHSLRNEAKQKYPTISAERLSKIPRNVLTRALGRVDTVELEIRTVSVRPGDAFMLCSDGVTTMLDDRRILEALIVAEGPQEACDLLTELSNEAGGRDNITVAALYF